MSMWVVRAGDKGQHEHKVLADGIAAIGYRMTPDPMSFEDKERLRVWYSKQYPELSPGTVLSDVSQIWNFTHSIQQGDLVILPCKKKPIVWLGKIRGDYRFEEAASDLRHARPVEWTSSVPRSAFDSERNTYLNRQGAVYKLNTDEENGIQEIFSSRDRLSQLYKELVVAYANVARKVANSTTRCPNIKFEHEMEAKEALKSRFKEFLQDPTEEKFQSFWNRNYIWAATMGGNATNLIKKHNGLDPISEVLKQVDTATEYNPDWEHQLGASGALAEFWGKLKDQPIRNACADHALVFLGLENPRSYPDFLDEFKQFESVYQANVGQKKVTPYPVEIELDQLFNFVDKATDTDLVENPDIQDVDVKALYAIKKQIDDILHLPHAQSWIFQAVPERFDLLERLPRLGEEPWSANKRRGQMHVGDTVYYWKAGEDAGIYGIGRLVSPPQKGLDVEFGEWGVVTKIERFLGSQYIPKQTFLENPVLRESTIIKSPQGTNFLLSNKQASEIANLIPPSPSEAVPTDRQYWVEITEIENTNRPDRTSGAYACGKALWSPQTSDSGSRIYSNMERVKPGDIVFHFTDSKGFTGVSIADSEVDREWTDVPPNTKRSDRDAYFLVKLKCYEKLTPRLDRAEIFDNGEVWQQLLNILTEFNQKRSDSESDRLGRFLFYNHDQRLQQGAYLSEAPPELVQLLNQVYERKTGHGLPYVFDATPIDCGHISPDILPIQPKYRIEDFIEDSGFKRGQIEMWERRLRHKQHIVFQGPPGTGKTFVAKKLAQMMVSETDGFYTIVQFHPSYGYEDFMHGIRPQVADGKLFYDVKDGTFLKFCDAASKRNENTPCILIIDEMNRAKLSRVFGELMYLLENRGEGEAIPLAYADEKRPSFAIPPNVYLIATMNTADRSIALVDHALRRRFSFIFLEPDYDVLRNYLVKHNLPSKQLPEVLEKMNARLIRDRHYQLGISYFMREDLKETIGDIWEGEIESYLDEYLYGKDIKIDPYRWINLCKDHLDEWSN